MERSQILKVMVPVGAFAVLLLIVGGVIALNSGGGTSPPTLPLRPTEPNPVGQSRKELGSVPLDTTGMTDQMSPLDAPEWRDLGSQAVPGVKVWDVTEGTEDVTATLRDTVKVHYTGWRTDGFSFDGSAKHGGEPIEFALTGVIAGWTHGIPGMKVGGIRRLYIPAEHAYGANPPQRSNIPPNAPLVFEVKLLRVIRTN